MEDIMDRSINCLRTSRIYVVCMNSWSEEHQTYLHGRWISATQHEDRILGEIEEMLKSTPAKNARRWMIAYWENFGDFDLYYPSGSICYFYISDEYHRRLDNLFDLYLDSYSNMTRDEYKEYEAVIEIDIPIADLDFTPNGSDLKKIDGIALCVETYKSPSKMEEANVGFMEYV